MAKNYAERKSSGTIYPPGRKNFQTNLLAEAHERVDSLAKQTGLRKCHMLDAMILEHDAESIMELVRSFNQNRAQ